jgi:hypothetical protein
MQAREVLHKLLIQTCGEMHAVRREALETLVWAGLTSQRMTVTGLGRAIGGVARSTTSSAPTGCCRTRICNPNARRCMGC